MTALLQLAITLLVDLGLNKLPDDASRRQQTVMDDARIASGFGASTDSRSHTAEEQRAFAGCFYLTSVYVILFSKSGAMLIDEVCPPISENQMLCDMTII